MNVFPSFVCCVKALVVCQHKQISTSNINWCFIGVDVGLPFQLRVCNVPIPLSSAKVVFRFYVQMSSQSVSESVKQIVICLMGNGHSNRLTCTLHVISLARPDTLQ